MHIGGIRQQARLIRVRLESVTALRSDSSSKNRCHSRRVEMNQSGTLTLLEAVQIN